MKLVIDQMMDKTLTSKIIFEHDQSLELLLICFVFGTKQWRAGVHHHADVTQLKQGTEGGCKWRNQMVMVVEFRLIQLTPHFSCILVRMNQLMNE